MARETKIRANACLSPLPTDDELLAAIAEMESGSDRRWHFGATANALAWQFSVEDARRLGNGAVKGSWSGRMSGSLRVAPRLRSLVRRGLLAAYYEDGRRYYTLTRVGRDVITSRGVAVDNNVQVRTDDPSVAPADDAGVWAEPGYEVENLAAIRAGDVICPPGVRVYVHDEHEEWGGCEGVVKAVGIGVGAYSGQTYDVLLDGTVDAERFEEAWLREAARRL